MRLQQAAVGFVGANFLILINEAPVRLAPRR
jgi:hypothetical protein